MSGEFELRWEEVCHHLLLPYNHPIIVLRCPVVRTHNFSYQGTFNKQFTVTMEVFSANNFTTPCLMGLLLTYSFFFSGDGSSEVKSESPFPTDELGDMGTVSIVSS